ncbi:MAG: hypothetical protein EHM89_02770 [Acidobacteria bacterium]|nr:MAG: hypothetical protein EHM89_02770 [Acidobacteriota bacterium]
MVAGDAGNRMHFIEMGVVARSGIEQPTRGFSVRGRARFGLTNPKAVKGFLAGRAERTGSA